MKGKQRPRVVILCLYSSTLRRHVGDEGVKDCSSAHLVLNTGTNWFTGFDKQLNNFLENYLNLKLRHEFQWMICIEFQTFNYNKVFFGIFIYVLLSEGEEGYPDDNINNIFLPLRYQTNLLFTRWGRLFSCTDNKSVLQLHTENAVFFNDDC